MRIIAVPGQFASNRTSTAADITSFAYASYAGDNTYAVAVALLLYDHALTFSEEIDLVWKRKWTGVSVLFVFNRALSIAFALSMMLFLMNWKTLSSCTAVGIFYTIPELLLAFEWGCFSALRVYALSGRARVITAFIFILSLAPVAVLLYNSVSLKFFELWLSPTMKLCIESSGQPQGLPKPLAIVTSSSQVIADILVVGVTWRNTFHLKTTALATNMKTPLVTLVLRDGTIYFIILLCLNAVLMTTYIISNAYVNLTYLLYAFTCIIVSRFLLNIRQVSTGSDHDALDEDRHEFARSRMSTVDFTRSIVRDIGAQLAYSFDDERMSFESQATVLPASGPPSTV